MQIYTNLKHDDSATATLQLSAAEFEGIRKFMHTPAQFTNVKFPNGVYLNKTGFGWYKLTTSNDFNTRQKIETALTIIRKIDRHMRGAPGSLPSPPRALGVHFKSEPPQKAPRASLMERLLARA